MLLRGKFEKLYCLGALFSAFLIAITIGACGPVGPTAQQNQQRQNARMEAALAAIGGYSGDGIDENMWRCPAHDNVLLQGGYAEQDVSGTRNYTVCVSRTDASRLLVVPHTNRNICVFPAQKSANSWYLLEAERCSAVYANTPQIFDFQSTAINDVVIVDQANSYTFKQCLNTAVNCPPYSQGF